MIMDIFRPFISQRQLISTISSNPRRPETIFALSLSHLRNLTQYYYETFKGTAEAYTVSWVHGPLYVAPAILRYEKPETRRESFIRCMQTCTGLVESHPVLDGFVRALFGMAVAAEVFSSVEAVEHYSHFRVKGEENGRGTRAETGFVVDQDLATENHDSAVGDVLAKKFDEMMVAERRRCH